MRRTTGAILIEMRPDRMSRSAWRGEARKASKPKRAMSRGAPPTDIISMAQQAKPNVAGKSELPLAQLAARSSVVVMTRSWTYCSRSSPSRSPRSICCARSCRTRKSSGVPAFSRFTISMTFSVLAPLECAASPHIYERDDQEADEDCGLDQGERPERPQLHGDRVEEHDLDVEQDEQHRDQVEADPEAEALLDLRGHARLIGLRLVGGRGLRLRPQQAAGADEQRTDETAEAEEDDGWKVRPEHSASRCLTN